MNPMIRKELRQRMRERRGWMLPTLYLLVLGGTAAIAYYFGIANFGGVEPLNEPQGAEIGVSVFVTVAFTQMAVLLLLAPVFSAGALTIEKEQRTLAGLLTSLLSPAEIWYGKFTAALMFLALLQISALPVLSLAFALGGISPVEVAALTGMTMLILASLIAVGLYCSSYFRRSVHATAVSYAVVIALTVLTFVAYLILDRQWRLSAGPLASQLDAPGYVGTPLYLNPFVALASVFVPFEKSPYPDWLISIQLFAALGCFSTALALRNLERGGDQV